MVAQPRTITERLLHQDQVIVRIRGQRRLGQLGSVGGVQQSLAVRPGDVIEDGGPDGVIPVIAILRSCKSLGVNIRSAAQLGNPEEILTLLRISCGHDDGSHGGGTCDILGGSRPMGWSDLNAKGAHMFISRHQSRSRALTSFAPTDATYASTAGGAHG